jgi:hypothetical protein
MSICFMGMHLMGVNVTGTYPIGIQLMGMHFMGV